MVSLCLLGLFELRIVLNETTFRPGEFSRTKTFYLSKDPPSLNTQTVSLSPWLFVFHPPIVYSTYIALFRLELEGIVQFRLFYSTFRSDVAYIRNSDLGKKEIFRIFAKIVLL